MAALSSTAATDLLTLLFINTSWADVGDGPGLLKSAADGNWTFALSTGTLVAGSDQSTTEATYTSYARKSFGRGAATWTVTAAQVTNDSVIQFVAATGGTNTITDFSIGTDQQADEMYIFGALTASLNVSNGIQPEFAAGDMDVNVT